MRSPDLVVDGIIIGHRRRSVAEVEPHNTTPWQGTLHHRFIRLLCHPLHRNGTDLNIQSLSAGNVLYSCSSNKQSADPLTQGLSTGTVDFEASLWTLKFTLTLHQNPIV